jgi:hypothetical protein
MKSVTIWGLKNKRNSLRFIHKGFYENFMKLGYDTRWVNDEARNQNIQSDIFFVSGVASKYIKFNKSAIYILHNVELSDNDAENIRRNNINHLNLQVFTKDAYGEILQNGNTIYNHDINTLFQPWGTPLSPNEWYPYVPKNRFKIEFWVGSIWNNQMNQGNKTIMNTYKQILRKHGVTLIKRGGSKLNVNGLSDSKNSQLVRKSRIGATIVGEWQKSASYIPCRLFKNISFGVAPISNMRAPIFLNNKNGFIDNLQDLINFAMSESDNEKMLRLESARADLRMFTYEENIKRIVKVLASR